MYGFVSSGTASDFKPSPLSSEQERSVFGAIGRLRPLVDFIRAECRVLYLRAVVLRRKRGRVITSAARRVLDYLLVPYLIASRSYESILIVGVSRGTSHYPQLLRDKKAVWTIDSDPMKQPFGYEERHILDSIENINKYFPDGTLDCVMMNGVYGWGLNSEPAMASAVQGIHRALRPGGVLLLGWNTGDEHDPISLENFRPLKSLFRRYRVFGASRFEVRGIRSRLTRRLGGLLGAPEPAGTAIKAHIYDLYTKAS